MDFSRIQLENAQVQLEIPGSRKKHFDYFVWLVSLIEILDMVRSILQPERHLYRILLENRTSYTISNKNGQLR